MTQPCAWSQMFPHNKRRSISTKEQYINVSCGRSYSRKTPCHLVSSPPTLPSRYANYTLCTWGNELIKMWLSRDTTRKYWISTHLHSFSSLIACGKQTSPRLGLEMLRGTWEDKLDPHVNVWAWVYPEGRCALMSEFRHRLWGPWSLPLPRHTNASQTAWERALWHRHLPTHLPPGTFALWLRQNTVAKPSALLLWRQERQGLLDHPNKVPVAHPTPPPVRPCCSMTLTTPGWKKK